MAANYYLSKMKKERKKSRLRRIFIFLFLLILIAGSVLGFLGYMAIYKPNVSLNGQKTAYINIKEGQTWDDVRSMLYKNGNIINRDYFEQVATVMKYPGHIKPGHYVLDEKMGNRELIAKLRSGKQDPVKLVFNNIRTKEDLAGRLAEQLSSDSAAFLKLFNDEKYLQTYGVTPITVTGMFIPNTYEVYWNISPEKLMERMNKEFKAFWNDNRLAKLKEIGLTQMQAITLASIVEKESNMNAEKPIIAGVYMNRLKQGWLLQADPTLIFALGDFSIKRVLNVYKTINSPYNTYKYGGLPPGPICLPSIPSIDAVLNYHQHNYMFFCAKEDFSGYHNFAVTMSEQNANAERYQRALDQRGIMK